VRLKIRHDDSGNQSFGDRTKLIIGGGGLLQQGAANDRFFKGVAMTMPMPA
jgi:hypothetical protein